MFRRHARALAPLAVLLLLAAGCAKPADQAASGAKGAGALKVGLVFDVGGRGDKSFNDAAAAGLDSAKKALGVEVATIETGEGTDREAAMRQLAAGGNQLVFGVGFLFSDDILQLAKEFPNVNFACIDYTVKPGDTLPPNLAALTFREEEGSFLVGALAAGLSHTGKVGFVGGMEIPLIKKFEAGYKAGVHAVRPKADVIVKYAGTTGAAFKDPTKGKELGLAEYQQGADIIYHASGSTGLGVFEAAKDTKHLAIGVDSDQYDEAPGTVVSSMVKHVEVAVFNTIRASQQGHFQGGVQSYGLAENGVGWVYDARNAAQIPAPVKATVDSLRDLIVAGKIAVPSQ
ncbi:MAG TPA: BMP family ABC transporter substrate-binding protein [Candidatus Saccharimonadaceae bacterium]|jgi:basic membrane protein A|nr:BMP family ABC transporter substrate-binding protein [Candidatus Saccharimonadaceae bacterium]